MKAKRIKHNLIITLPASVGPEKVQDILDFARQQELTSKNKVDPKVMEKLADEIMKTWWAENQHNYS